MPHICMRDLRGNAASPRKRPCHADERQHHGQEEQADIGLRPRARQTHIGHRHGPSRDQVPIVPARQRHGARLSDEEYQPNQ